MLPTLDKIAKLSSVTARIGKSSLTQFHNHSSTIMLNCFSGQDDRDGEEVGRMGGSGSDGRGSESNEGENRGGNTIGRRRRSRRGPADGHGDVSDGGAPGASCG